LDIANEYFIDTFEAYLSESNSSPIDTIREVQSSIFFSEIGLFFSVELAPFNLLFSPTWKKMNGISSAENNRIPRQKNPYAKRNSENKHNSDLSNQESISPEKGIYVHLVSPRTFMYSSNFSLDWSL